MQETAREPEQSEVSCDTHRLRRSFRLLAKPDDRMLSVEDEKNLASDHGLRVHNFGCVMGRTVITSKCFSADSPVAEYKGDIRTGHSDSQSGFIYQFYIGDAKYTIDATAECGSLGRLINHSRHCGNVKAVAVAGKCGTPRLIFRALKNIDSATELLYDYGDRSPKAVKYNPWLRESPQPRTVQGMIQMSLLPNEMQAALVGPEAATMGDGHTSQQDGTGDGHTSQQDGSAQMSEQQVC